MGKRKDDDVMMNAKVDRRLLSHVPDAEQLRKQQDRRGSQAPADKSRFSHFAGQRYETHFSVSVRDINKKGMTYKGECRDISQTGLLILFKEDPGFDIASRKIGYKLHFRVPSGAMSEGLENIYRINAMPVRRIQPDNQEEGIAYGFELAEPLYRYTKRRKDRLAYSSSVLMMLLVVLFIMLLRAESILYFKFNKTLYLYSILAAAFLLSRYLFGALYRPVPLDPTFTPGVTVIIPCFNEETWIARTIISCVDQDYPVDQLEVIVVDDGSSDNSVKVIKETLDELHAMEGHFKTRERVSFVVQEKNAGKREALARGVALARHELVAFVDSDSFLEPDAIRNLVQPLADPQTAGVSGRTDVANTFTNMTTKMQAVRYYISFRIMKAAEAYFDSVMCLSGPLSCYRKSVVQENVDKWLTQTFLGQKATFGDDRGMTNMVVKKHRTYYQDTAICSTIVPNKQKVFLRQQMRWKRSWLRESLIAATFMWKKEPLMALSFYSGLLIPVVAPLIVIYNLVYVPFVYRVFPTTFLTGLLMMALLMSVAQLMLRKSSLWLYGLLFCIYYEAILLWQMPWAWLTFWVSTWGTRMTPSDVLAEEKKQQRKAGKQQRTAAKAHNTADNNSSSEGAGTDVK